MSVVANYEEDGGLHALTEERPVSDWKRRLAKVHCTGWLVGWVRPASSSSLSLANFLFVRLGSCILLTSRNEPISYLIFRVGAVIPVSLGLLRSSFSSQQLLVALPQGIEERMLIR